ncbi:MAG: beta strand repeat-containing protein [Roseateles sp.]
MHQPRRIALAAAALLMSLSTGPGRAAVTVTGPWFSNPGAAGPLDGPNLFMPGTQLYIAGAGGSFSATAGSQVDLGSFYLGFGGLATGVLDGAGTAMRLHSPGHLARLTVGGVSAATLTVSGGALLDGRVDEALCVSGGWCGSWVGDAAGSSGLLTVTGAGSEARLLGTLQMAGIHVDGSYGTAGAKGQGEVRVEQGGVLRTQGLSAGDSWISQGNGLERSEARVSVQGADSAWWVEANTVNGAEASASFASGSRASAVLSITGGGRFEVVGKPGQNYSLRLGNGGMFNGEVSGVGSVLALSGDAHQGRLHIGEGGLASFSVLSGGRLIGAPSNLIGLNGGEGSLDVRGAGSQAQFQSGHLDVGHGGTGRLSVAQGGAVSALSLSVGIGASGQGSVVVDGAGSVLTLANTDGHRLSIGNGGEGRLTVSGGALLDATLDAAACNFKWCGTSVGHWAGGTGTLTVTGAGSEARFLSGFAVATAQVATQAVDGWTGGTVGGRSTGRIEVLDGALLVTKEFGSGVWHSPSSNGAESSFAEGLVSGAGSRWLVNGSALEGHDARVNLAVTAHSFADWQVQDGGALLLVAPTGTNAGLDLGNDGGQATLAVQGSGSRVLISGMHARLVAGMNGGQGSLQVGQGGVVELQGGSGSYVNLGESGGTGALTLTAGGQLTGARSVNVGSGGNGSLLIDGVGSLLSTDRRGSFVGQLNVATSGSGRLDVLNGGAASVFALQVGSGFTHAGNTAVAVINGVGSRVTADAIDWHRLGLENGSLTVSGGGVLDAASNAAGCVGHWCGAFVANNAGGDVRFTITGAGSRASFLSHFIVGGSYVTAPPGTPYTLGEPGAASRVLIEVLDGGLLQTEMASLGYGPQGPAALGSEAATVKVRLDGAGSRWTLTPNTQGGPNGATTLNTGVAGGANTDVQIAVSGGARLELQAQDGQTANLQLAREGGSSMLSVIGSGSELAFSGGTTRTLLIGRNQGQGSVVLMDGGRLSGASNVLVGLNQGSSAASGLLMLDGAQTRGQIAGDLVLLRVGQGAWGMVQLGQGAQLAVDGSQSAFVTVGSYNFNAPGSAILSLSDPGTRLDVRSGGGTALANASMTVGSTFGMLDVSGGAQLRLHGGFEASAAAPLLTTLTIGSSTTLASGLLPGQGFMTVSGAGSRVEVAGADPRVMIGMNGGLGIANIQDGAVLATSYVGIGGNGGQGQLHLNAARAELAGQWTSQLLGPRLAVGFGSGSTGLVTLTQGAEVVLDGRGGPDRAALVLGGVTGLALGSGRLQASGGASLTLLGAGSALFGQTGNGIGEFSGASRLDLDGGTLFIARYAGASGELHLREASQAHAGTVLVGASAPGVDGGQGWLQVTGGSALHASRLDIGSAGLLSGSGLIDVALLTNRGSINPGDSPGTLQLTGDFVNEAGGRLVLEVEADGHGGFVTDRLAFASGARIDLGAALIEFRFLGATDPNAFQASGGFRIDSFLSQGGAPLDHALLGEVSYAASSSAYRFTSFSFSADGGATFTAQPVPEPGTWVLFALGLGVTGWLQRRKQQRA